MGWPSEPLLGEKKLKERPRERQAPGVLVLVPQSALAGMSSWMSKLYWPIPFLSSLPLIQCMSLENVLVKWKGKNPETSPIALLCTHLILLWQQNTPVLCYPWDVTGTSSHLHLLFLSGKLSSSSRLWSLPLHICAQVSAPQGGLLWFLVYNGSMQIPL